MAAGFVTHVTCRLTAKNRDQLRNPTLGNRVWATVTFFNVTRLRHGVFAARLRAIFQRRESHYTVGPHTRCYSAGQVVR